MDTDLGTLGVLIILTIASGGWVFRHARGYRRQLTFTPMGVIAEETADDPALTDAIRAHAREVTGFVQQGMPAMMQQMMGPGGMMGGMGCGGMMGGMMGPGH